MGRKTKTEFGDFQTPYALARRVCDLIHRPEISPRSIVEPTCGTGSFLQASADAFPDCRRIFGFEINPGHVSTARTVRGPVVRRADFFEMDWPATLGALPDPVLVVGNPPWVTNSAVASIGGSNLPVKSNFRRLNGLDALTGSSNFDISEWMLTHLLELLSGRETTLAMLCKTTVARKVLRHAWSRNLQVGSAALHLIDAAAHFGVSVDACLLVCVLRPGHHTRECRVYPSIEAIEHDSVFAYRTGRLVADLEAFDDYGHLSGRSSLRWRSGVKHDCTRVMELRPAGEGAYTNGMGEVHRLEATHLYPMLKSSDLMKPDPVPSRYMLVTQRSVGEDTARIEHDAPGTWSYLQAHAHHLDRRASSIYRNRPRFSVFGVGPYSFAPWKVAISGFYKRLRFRAISPVEGKPVMVDDTCYFLPCTTKADAHLVAGLLNSKAAGGFLGALIFWDAKRPITARVLANLDLDLLAGEAGVPLPVWTPTPGVPTLFDGSQTEDRAGSSPMAS